MIKYTTFEYEGVKYFKKGKRGNITNVETEQEYSNKEKDEGILPSVCYGLAMACAHAEFPNKF